jgi:hypothetical protein
MAGNQLADGDWLRRWLLATGRMDADGITRQLRGGHCPRCAQSLLQGLDGDVAALTIHADPLPLTRTGEAAYVLLSATTYRMRASLKGWTAHPRVAGEIRRQPASLTVRVLGEHCCGMRWPAGLYHPPPRAPRQPTAPPF